ncbi:MAG: DUF134 domain-containing protein [Euryarchaeota archaeon]|nr:DUF134 domain-containing protein [Euryarchaeota archaeon]
MPRPKCRPKIGHMPKARSFKPQGVPMSEIEAIEVGPEEVESMRLVDLEGLSQLDAADRMGISQPTLCRLLASCRTKVIDAIVNGKAIGFSTSERGDTG